MVTYDIYYTTKSRILQYIWQKISYSFCKYFKRKFCARLVITTETAEYDGAVVILLRMVMAITRKKRFFVNGILLTATSLLLRGVGVAFGAFVTGKMGADGMGLYTLIMSVYGLAVTAASAGVNLAATRLCAEAIGKDSPAHLRAALRRCLVWALLCGSIACTLLFSGAEWVAGRWLGDIRCTRSLRLLALSLPFIAASNVLHGYFTAVRRVSRSAASQIFEQLFKMLVCMGAFAHIAPGDIEAACIVLVGGGALAELASFLFALVLYLIDRRHAGNHRETCRIDGKAITREMFGIILPVAAAAFARSGLSTLEHMLIPRGLRANPATAETALASYGVLCGMAMPVVLFPTALLYSFTGLLVPEFAEADARGDRGRIRGMVSRALGMTLIFSIGCAGILGQFADELGMLIYKSADAGQFIRVMAPLVPVMYFDHAVDAMLKGLGEQVYSMKVNILDAALCAALVWLLCPRIGIWGYVVTIYIAEVVNASLSLWRLAKVTQFAAGISRSLVRPLAGAAGALALTRLCGFAVCAGWGQLLLGCIFSAAVYFMLLVLLGAVTRRDLAWAAGVFR